MAKLPLKALARATARRAGFGAGAVGEVDLDSAYFEARRSIFEAMPRSKGGIIFVGDSLTEYCAWAELLERPGILNRGIGGEPVEGLRRRVSEIARHEPRQIFVMSGVNDLIGNLLPQHKSTNSLALAHKALLRDLQAEAPQSQIVLQSLLPLSRANFSRHPDAQAHRLQEQANAAVREVNAALATLAQGEQVVFADVHAHLLDGTQQLGAAYSLDGLHLTGAGYAKWKQAVLPLLRP